MAYDFTFDISPMAGSLLDEISLVSYGKKISRTVIRQIVEKFNLHKLLRIDMEAAVTIVEDLINVYSRNHDERELFMDTKKRALFIPHCSRKFMDSRCKAVFDEDYRTFKCMKCSSDCRVSHASKLGEERGYDVFILPGGSCIRKIIENGKYDAVAGVACTQELRLWGDFVESKKIIKQEIPLMSNGCANTKFSMELLDEIL